MRSFSTLLRVRSWQVAFVIAQCEGKGELIPAIRVLVHRGCVRSARYDAPHSTSVAIFSRCQQEGAHCTEYEPLKPVPIPRQTRHQFFTCVGAKVANTRDHSRVEGTRCVGLRARVASLSGRLSFGPPPLLVHHKRSLALCAFTMELLSSNRQEAIRLIREQLRCMLWYENAHQTRVLWLSKCACDYRLTAFWFVCAYVRCCVSQQQHL